MFLRPPPPPPSREIKDFSGETTESIIRHQLWEEDMRKWEKEREQFEQLIKSSK